jgi:molybdate transport system substrate-binding protein
MHRTLLLTLLLVVAAPAADADAQTLIVSAAASLTDAFSDMEPAFEAAHSGVDVVMNFAASGALYRQMEQGAPVDVFASANPLWMDRAVQGGLVAQDAVAVFARNALVLAVPADNPAGVAGLEDLSRARAGRIGMGTPATVPAGQYAKAALDAAGLYARLEPRLIFCESVRQVLDYLVRGEVDCGFVYRTDAVRAGNSVRVVAEVPLQTPVAYPMAVLADSAHPGPARAFVDFVSGPRGRALLRARGFVIP